MNIVIIIIIVENEDIENPIKINQNIKNIKIRENKEENCSKTTFNSIISQKES